MLDQASTRDGVSRVAEKDERVETPHVERLVKVVRNPGTWKTLRKLLVEEEEEVKAESNRAKLLRVAVAAPPPPAAYTRSQWKRLFAEAREHNVHEELLEERSRRRSWLYA